MAKKSLFSSLVTLLICIFLLLNLCFATENKATTAEKSDSSSHDGATSQDKEVDWWHPWWHPHPWPFVHPPMPAGGFPHRPWPFPHPPMPAGGYKFPHPWPHFAWKFPHPPMPAHELPKFPHPWFHFPWFHHPWPIMHPPVPSPPKGDKGGEKN